MIGETVPEALAALEIDLLMQAVGRAYALDTGRLPRPLVETTAAMLVRRSGARSVSGLVERVLHEPAFGREALQALCACDVRLFHDWVFHRNVREQVVPWLRTYPYSAVWLAECGAGGEVYSFAILLAECGLLDRVTIHATDRDPVLLAHARQGAVPLGVLKEAQASYRRAGGTGSLSAHFVRQGNRGVLSEALQRRIVWSNYDLGTGHSFNEFHFIVCRAALDELPAAGHRVLRLLTDSLSACGLLALNGDQRRILDPNRYRPWRPGTGIYQRTA